MLNRVDKWISLLVSLVIGLLVAIVAILADKISGWTTWVALVVGLLLIVLLIFYRQEYIFNGPKPRKGQYEKGEYKIRRNWKIEHKGGCQGNNRGVERKRLRLGGRDLQALSFNVTTSEPYWRAGIELSSTERQRAEMNTVGSLLFHIGRNGTKNVYPDPNYGLQHLQDRYAVIAYCDQSLEATSPPNRLGKGKEELIPIITEQVLGNKSEPGETFTVNLSITGPVGERVLLFQVVDQDDNKLFEGRLSRRIISGFLKNCYLVTWADEVGETSKSRKYNIILSEIMYRAFPKV